MKYTKTLKKTIDEYGLKLIHTGSLGYKGARYTNSELYFEWPKENQDGQYVLEFNYFDQSKAQWLTFERVCNTRKEAEQIKKKEFGRRLWDSRHLFFEGAGIRKQLVV